MLSTLTILRDFAERLLHDSGIDALLHRQTYNAAIRAMIERRMREVFLNGISAFAALALLLLTVGWGLLGMASSRYGMADAAPEVAHYALGLAAGQISAIWYTMSRCIPAAYLDHAGRHQSGEWAALESLHIDACSYVCVPWLITAPLAAACFWCLYYLLYLSVELCFPAMASAVGIPFVPIHSGAFATLDTWVVATVGTAGAGFSIAWVALLMAARRQRLMGLPPPLRRDLSNTRRVSALALIAAAAVEVLLHAVLGF